MKSRLIQTLLLAVVAAFIALVIYYFVGEHRLLLTGLIVMEVILLPIIARRTFNDPMKR